MRPYLRGISGRVKHETVRRSARRPCRVYAIALAAALVACGGSPTAERDPNAAKGDFSSALAWADLEDLAQGPRELGSEGAEAARGHIRARLAAAGIAVETVTTTAESKSFGPLALTHLVATLPGASPDRIVLIAPYDSGVYDGFSFVGANDGASGAALLIELARALSARSLPYTVELVWLEGEGRIGHGTGDDRELRWLGSRGLAERWAETGHLRGIRLLVAFNRVCDADLRIARDSASHREFREEFWKTARHLGYADAFAPTRGYESVESSGSAFRDRGVRAVVAIEDSSFGGDDAPGLYAGKDDVLKHCAPESLDVVGRVAVETVSSIATRLAKIDRFARMPNAEPESPAKPSGSKPAGAAPPAPPSEPQATGAAPPAPPPEPSATEASAPAGATPEAPDAPGSP